MAWRFDRRPAKRSRSSRWIWAPESNLTLQSGARRITRKWGTRTSSRHVMSKMWGLHEHNVRLGELRGSTSTHSAGSPSSGIFSVYDPEAKVPMGPQPESLARSVEHETIVPQVTRISPFQEFMTAQSCVATSSGTGQ